MNNKVISDNMSLDLVTRLINQFGYCVIQSSDEDYVQYEINKDDDDYFISGSYVYSADVYSLPNAYAKVVSLIKGSEELKTFLINGLLKDGIVSITLHTISFTLVDVKDEKYLLLINKEVESEYPQDDFTLYTFDETFKLLREYSKFVLE